MKKRIVLAISLITFTSAVNAQTSKKSIDDQFTSLINESSNWQSYKVVEKGKLNQLQRNVLEATNQLQNEIDSSKAAHTEQKASLNAITSKLSTTEEALNEALSREDNLDIIGIPTSKSTFKILVCIVIAILLLALAGLFVQFKKSYTDTKEARKKLIETEEELEELKKRSLEREQKIRRQLQDEINKNRRTESN
ncbi:hypothetical protein [Myroides guanonis]|uniref:tRNA (Guanine-N1)-methyltransferase n=1 Tax=Myroides guanonis TaxID=1150112 RepID=A0A1I3LC39_9FLAO|nr:hypothetical protein [Myroides guanonis]SFI82323.1 hypothetical protein SAMN04487893_101264 [Myroides guanonis]